MLQAQHGLPEFHDSISEVDVGGIDAQQMGGAARAAALLVLLLSLGLCASAKRLVVFGDSISDNGNGTSKVVQAYFTSLLGSSVTSVGARPNSPFPSMPSAFAEHACMPWALNSAWLVRLPSGLPAWSPV